MADALIWLIALRALSAAAFPAAHLLLGRLADRGWTVSAALGLLLLAWATWLGGSVGVIPNTPSGIWIALLAMAGLAGWLAYRQRAELADFYRRRWTVIAATELIFLGMFVFWALAVSEAPAINHTEKPMDFGIMNAVARADGFPPEDQWLSGHGIAYYYGGHYVAAMLSQLTGIAADVAYNLAVATVPALLAAGLLGIGYNLLRFAGARVLPALAVGAAAAVGITMLGNLTGLLELAYARGIGGAGFWQWVGIKDLLDAPAGIAGGGGWLPGDSWWWWRSTRVIDTLGADGASLDYTITEFPFFSFLLGDLHAHMTALPFAVLALAMAMALLAAPQPPGLDWLRRRPVEAGALALSVGALAFINAWDFPLYIGIVMAAAALRWFGWLSAPSAVAAVADAAPVRLLGRAAGRAALLAAGLAAGGIILYLPFYMSLDSQAQGILPVLGPATRPLHFLLVMGTPALLAAALVVRAALLVGWPTPALCPVAIAVLLGSLAPLLLWLLAAGLRISVSPESGAGIADAVVAQRLTLALPLLLMGGLAAYCALACAAGGSGRPPLPWLAFTLLLAGAGFGLLAAAELFHIADQFGNRMNTVFKIYYQAWLLLGIAGAVGIYCIVADPLRRRKQELGRLIMRVAGIAYAVPAAVLLLASAYYPVGAIIDRTGWTQPGESGADNTLSGLDYLRRDAPGEYAAIAWLNGVEEPGRIVEAVGDDYTDYGRIAAATGRASVLGWRGHQLQWRGDDAAFAGRAEDVADIYGSDDGDRVISLLQRYNVRWVVVGPRESDAYGGDTAKRMAGWADAGRLREVFAAHAVVIYEVVE